MTSPSTRRFPALDGVRAFAAFAVVCTHVGFISGRSLDNDLLGPILSRGDFGVALFFLLSGFLLYRPFALHCVTDSPAPRLGRFLWRRALRIVPAVAVFVVVTLTFLTTFSVRAVDYVQYLLLIQTYDHHNYDTNLAHLWTLSVEVSFYLALPLLARMAARFRGDLRRALLAQAVLLGGLYALAIAFNLYQMRYLKGTQALLWLPAYTDWFAFGMALAVLTAIPAGAPVLTRFRTMLNQCAGALGTCWLIAAVLFLIATLPLGIPRGLAPALFWQWTAQHILYGFAAFFILLPLVLGDHPGADRVLGGTIGRFGGSISYGVYLWHVPLIPKVQSALGYREFDGHFLWLLVGTLAAAIAAASASWYLVERPALRYVSLPRRQPGPRTPNTTAATHSS